MCGIAATLRPSSNTPPLNLRLIQHRGPDASGEVRLADGRVWLGHCRPSILDLSPAGAQPMHDPLTSNWIIFNGEIYNHLTLRSELEKVERMAWLGHSDTETLLAAYRIWGISMLPRLKGMFAFIIYDAGEQTLFVSRDRFGIKPLYFAEQNGTFYFASETRAVSDRILTKLTPESVAAYLQFGACPEQLLLYPQIASFEAGTWLKLRIDGRRDLGKFWPPPSFERREISREDAPKLIRRLLELSVKEHLLSDVPVAVLLSGGIDSSIITALAAQASSQPLNTFSVGFKESGFDETAVAQEIAARYATNHERIELTENEVLQDVTEAVACMDLPSVDAINTYIVTKRIAQRGFKVVLSGLGADELFGGYPIFGEMGKLQWMSRTKRLWRWGASALGPLGKRMCEMPSTGELAPIARWRRVFWTNQMLIEAGLPIPEIEWERPPLGLGRFAQTSWAELTGYMRHMLLRDADQMSMVHPLEMRVPFLDLDLADSILQMGDIPHSRGSQIKSLLVGSCQDLLPRTVYERPKMGFTLPMDQWIKGPLQEFFTDGLRKCKSLPLVLKPTDPALHWTRLWSLAVLGHIAVPDIQPRLVD